MTDAPSAGGDTLTLSIIALPGDGGSAITALEYRVDGGAARTLDGTGAGERQIAVLAETLASVELRAVNSVGAGPWSAAKTATPTVALSAPSIAANAVRSGQTITFTVTSLSGNPPSTVEFQLLRLNGENVLSALSGAGPWTYTAPNGAVDAAVEYRIRATNSESFADAAGTVIVPATLFAPSQFAVDDWTLTDAPSLSGNTLTLSIIAPPNDGGAAITALEYRMDGGAARTLDGTGAGERKITVLAETLASVELRAVNSVGAGPWSAAKMATPTAAVAGPALDGLAITASRTAINGYEGVVFQVVGVTDETLREAEFLWDFGAGEAYDFTAPTADFNGDRSARFARGTVVGHVYRHPGGAADVTQQVSLTARLGTNVQTAMLGTPITISNPDVVYRGRTAYVGNPALWADREAFRTAAQAGSVDGILAADVAGLSIDYFWLQYVEPDPSTGFAMGALIFWRNNASPTAAKRILLQRGGEWPLFQLNSYGLQNIEHIGAFGFGARPTFVYPAVGTQGPSGVFPLDAAYTHDFVVWGVAGRGTYDPANPNRSDLGVIDYSSASNFISAGAANGEHEFPSRSLTFYDLAVEGFENGFMFSQGGMANVIVADSSVRNWRNYSVFGTLKDSALVGNSFQQPFDTKYLTAADGVTPATAGKTANPAGNANYSSHGTRINKMYNVGFHQSEVRQRGGWSGGVQPAIRAAVVYPEGLDGVVDGVDYTGDGRAWAAKMHDLGMRQHLSLTGNTIDGVGGLISFGYENTGNWLIPPRLLLSEGNFMIAGRAPDNGIAGAYSTMSGNVVARNDVIVVPEVEIGGSFPIIGNGPRAPTFWTPSGTLAELGQIRIKNATIVSKSPSAVTVTKFQPRTYYKAPGDLDRITDNTFYKNNWKLIHGWVNDYVAAVQSASPPAFHPLSATESLADKTALYAWLESNWLDLLAYNGWGPLARADADHVIVDNLYVFGDSGFIFDPAFDTPAGANLSAKYQPLTRSSLLGAASADAARLDYRAGVRPQPAALGALEKATDVTAWTIPTYAPPAVVARWEDALGNTYDPVDGDVFGVDFFAAGEITNPGIPALLESQLDVLAQRQNGATWEPLSGAVSSAQVIRVLARAGWHPAKRVTEETSYTVPANSDAFSATAVRFADDFLSGIMQGTTRAFTMAMAIRSNDETATQRLMVETAGDRIPRLTLGARNFTTSQAAWQFEDNTIDGGVKTGAVRSFVDTSYHVLRQAEFMVFTGEFDGANTVTFRLFRNGVEIGLHSRPSTSTSVFSFDNLAIARNATSAAASFSADVSRFFWLSTTDALDGAAASAAFFDLSLNAARDLGATGVINIGGTKYSPTLYIAGNAAEWNGGAARVGRAYAVTGAVADVGG